MFERLKNKFLFGLLNAEIGYICKDMIFQESKLKSLKQELENSVTRECLENYKLDQFLFYTFENSFLKIKENQTLKLRSLIDSTYGSTINQLHNSNTEKWIKNLSVLSIPKNVQHILSLGPSFNFENNKAPYHSIITSIETAIRELDEEEKISIRNETCNIMKNHSMAHRKKSFKEKLLTKYLVETKSFFKEHPEVLVTKADKGNITVVMDKPVYINKMENLLMDEQTYTKVNSDFTSSLQRKVNKYISMLEKGNYISDVRGKSLRTYNGVFPRIYGLPKIHKQNFPLRPIVTYIGSPLYNMSKFFADVLSNIVGKSEYHIRNSNEFLTKIKDITIPKDHSIISLDVTSLFTNISSKLVKKCIDKNWMEIKQQFKLKSEIDFEISVRNYNRKMNDKYTRKNPLMFPKKQRSLSKEKFMEGLMLLLDNCYFSYEKTFYKQIFGSPMGSPISPVLANLVMESLETEVLKKLEFVPIFYTRYVDDIILCIPTNKIDDTVTEFNKFHHRLQFTTEIEVNNQIAFLDVLLKKQENGSIKTDWYHKETWSGRYLNYNSSLPKIYKTNTIGILSQKILQLSHPSFQEKNFQLLRNVLLDNSYPHSLVDSVITKYKNLSSTTQTSTNERITTEENSRRFSFPYINGMFEKIKHVFHKRDIKIVGKPMNQLGPLVFSKLKDAIPKEMRSGLVYQLNCLDCDETYIGETKQYVSKRMYDHSYHIQIGDTKHSGAVSHSSSLNHKIDFENFNILTMENNTQKRRILEAINIKKHKSSMNIQEECISLDNVYNTFI